MDLPHKKHRRAVLKVLATLPATAVAAVLPTANSEAYDPGPDETRNRYRETEHVRAFYRTNGYETLTK